MRDAGPREHLRDQLNYPGIGDGRGGVFRLTADRPGVLYLEVSFRGGYNDQTAFVSVRVDAKPPGSPWVAHPDCGDSPGDRWVATCLACKAAK